MAGYHEEIQPAVIVKVEERIAPAYVVGCARSDSRYIGNVGKIHRSQVLVEHGIFIAEMRNGDRRESGVAVVAKRHAHVGLLISILANSRTRGKCDLGKMAV